MKYLIVILITCFSFSVYGEKKKPSIFLGIQKGQPSLITGVVMDEATAQKVAKQRVEFKDLKKTFELNRKLWEFKEKSYIDGLKKADKKIQKLSKQSWWDENKIWVGVVLGFVAGSAAAVLMYQTAKTTK